MVVVCPPPPTALQDVGIFNFSTGARRNVVDLRSQALSDFGVFCAKFAAGMLLHRGRRGTVAWRGCCGHLGAGGTEIVAATTSGAVITYSLEDGGRVKDVVECHEDDINRCGRARDCSCLLVCVCVFVLMHVHVQVFHVY